MGPELAATGAVIFGLLGVLHGVMTLRSSPDRGPMTPRDATVRKAMTRVGGLGFAPNANISVWQAWVGFNVSHSLGVIIFACVLAALSLTGERAQSEALSTAYVVLALGVPPLYLATSVRCWFIKPTRAIALATTLVYAGVLLEWLGT